MSEELSVKAVDDLSKEICELELKKEALEEKVTGLNKEINQKKFRCLNYLKEIDRKEYKSPFGEFTTKEEWRVKLPETLNDKNILRKHLEERGVFDDYWSIHSGSLNSLYKQDWEQAKNEGRGMEFNMPGVPPPVKDERASFKPNKKFMAELKKQVSNG